MNQFRTFQHPYLGIYTKCYLWQTDNYNVWIDSGLLSNWKSYSSFLTDGRQNVLLLTHGHWDHIGGVETIRQHGGKIYAHIADRRHLTDLQWHWQLLFGQYEQDFDLPPARKSTFWDSVLASDIDVTVEDGQTLVFDELKFRCLTTPGHSAGSVCFLEEKSGSLFTGDAVMGEGFFTGTPQIECIHTYIQSMEKLKEVKVTGVFTDHTDPVPGEELCTLLEKSQLCALRMLDSAKKAADSLGKNITLGDVAKAIAQGEGKNVGGGTMVTAQAALQALLDNPYAIQCAQNYMSGLDS